MQVERDCSCVVPAPAAVHRDITMTRTTVTQNTHSHSDIPDYLDTLLSSMSALKNKTIQQQYKNLVFRENILTGSFERKIVEG